MAVHMRAKRYRCRGDHAPRRKPFRAAPSRAMGPASATRQAEPDRRQPEAACEACRASGTIRASRARVREKPVKDYCLGAVSPIAILTGSERTYSTAGDGILTPTGSDLEPRLRPRAEPLAQQAPTARFDHRPRQGDDDERACGTAPIAGWRQGEEDATVDAMDVALQLGRSRRRRRAR